MKLSLVVIAFGLLLANKGFSQASETKSEVAPAAAMASWQSSFTSETLSDADVQGFEVRAEQKVKDFYNYVAIVSDAKYDIKLRQDARKQALDIFSSGTCTMDNESITAFLDSCMNMKQAISVQLGDVKVKQNLTLQSGNKEYNGTLECTVTNAGISKTKIISVSLYKKAKQFGSEQEMVWTVFICNIE